jgi:D-glycero-D-manno-heptose 1,7-bisphosphate phosphatase
MAVKKAIFLDKDGTLIPDVPYNVNSARISLAEGAAEGLKRLQQKGYLLIVITNQPGIALGLFKQEALVQVEQKLRLLMKEQNLILDGFYYCPHFPDEDLPADRQPCNCRKPRAGLFLQAAAEHGIDLSQSWMIGDILNDVEAGHHAGCRAILINNGNETEWKLNRRRMPDYMVEDINQAAEHILNLTLRLEKHENGIPSID